MIRYLSAPDVVRIHDRILARTGGRPGILSRDLLRSAVGRPQATYAGRELYPTVWLKAAALLGSLAQNHPFADANKRTAWLASKLFLRRNGKDVKATTEQAVSFILRVAQRQLSLEQIAFWLGGPHPEDQKGGASTAGPEAFWGPFSP